jgi:hypothetical protein
VGWLQNPIFYTEATNRAIIHYLPGYFPSQVAMVAAFTDSPIVNPTVCALLCSFFLLLVAGGLAYRRLRAFE